MVSNINAQVDTYALATFPDNYELPVSLYGERGEEQWYFDFPEELIGLEYFTTFNYNLLVGQAQTTSATIYRFGASSIRPNAYAFFDVGSYAYLDGESVPVYMVIVAKYFSTDTVGNGPNTYVNSVATYGVAYYAFNGKESSSFFARRLPLGYTPVSLSFSDGGILTILYNIGQYILERADGVVDLLNLKVVGVRLWQILFGGIGGGFIVYAGYCITKWIIPL